MSSLGLERLKRLEVRGWVGGLKVRGWVGGDVS